MANQLKGESNSIQQEDLCEVTVGLRLLQAREALQLNLYDIAEVLRLPIYVLQSIENNNFASLHGEVFVRSYIKAYANEVKLSADDVLELYTSQTQKAPFEKTSKVFVSSKKLAMPHRRYWLRLGAAAAVSIVVLAVIFFSSQQDDQLLIEHNNQTILVKAALGTTVIENLDLLSEQNSTDQSFSVNNKQVDSIGANPSSTLTSIDAKVGSTLRFQFSADCWVEVYDGNDKRIHASLKKPQDYLELSGKPPFRITLGYAPGVSLSYNGSPVTIDAATSRNKLTKLVLGNS